jgi:hypothetical protein
MFRPEAYHIWKNIEVQSPTNQIVNDENEKKSIIQKDKNTK